MTTETLSKAQVDRLGDRLRGGDPSDEDLVNLDQFRRSYAAGYEAVIGAIRENLGVEPTGRPAKSTQSIIEKLKRETIRLSQVQDIAGCRFSVLGALEQRSAADALLAALPGAVMDDRCQRPSHGYRALHVIARPDERPIEIQVRTALQRGPI